MKQFFCPALVAGSLLIPPISANALSTCQTYAECNRLCQYSGGQCCEETRTTYSCPTGWYASGSTCRRSSVSAGSDTKGYKETRYGTCPGTPNTQTCYMCSMYDCR